MSEPVQDPERDRHDGPSEDATADIEEHQDEDEGEEGRPPADAPAY
jgi:hypothetical protein